MNKFINLIERSLISFEDSKVYCPDFTFNYKDLNVKMNKFEKELLSIKSVNIVVNVTSSIETVALILSIWKCNKTFIPVDKQRMGIKRVDSILRQLDDYAFFDNLHCADNSKENVTPHENEIAYILFTSGTTGKPKGVQVTYDNLLNLYLSAEEGYDFTCKDTWINLHSLTFDFSMWEVFIPLLFGSNIVLLGDNDFFEFDEISSLILQYNVTVLNQTPSAFKHLIKYLNGDHIFKYVIFGGEKLHISDIEGYYKSHKKTKFVNMYGITEVTVHTTSHLIEDKDFYCKRESNVGKKFAATKVYLVDPITREEIKKQDVLGEITVQGDNVSRGYLNHLSENFNLDEKIYYSGDLGYINPEKDIIYVKRKDNQISKNGFRIELEDIKNVINDLDVFETFEIDYWDDKIYCYHSSEKKNDFKSIIKYNLPEYMNPNLYKEVDNFSLNKNGKLDIDYLRKCSNSKKKQSHNKYDFVRDYVEEKGLIFDANKSFIEIGLSSLELIDLHGKLIKNFNSLETVTVIDMFKFPKINRFIEHINQKETKSESVKS